MASWQPQASPTLTGPEEDRAGLDEGLEVGSSKSVPVAVDGDSENVCGKRSSCSPQGNQLRTQALGVLTAQIPTM